MATDQAAYALAAYQRFITPGQTRLYDMTDKFIWTPEPAAVNKDALAAAVAEADTLVALAYTPESWAAFAQKLSEARSVNNDAGATQARVNSALAALNLARQNLKAAGSPAAADKTALQEAYNRAAALTVANYEAGTWNYVAAAIAQAQAVLADDSATQAETDAARLALTDAVAALKPIPTGSDGTITVYFTLLGNVIHNSLADGLTYTLSGGGLTTWIEREAHVVHENATMRDVLENALTAAGLTWDNPSGNYVKAITKDGAELAQFTNGPNSGWMYTLNGDHSQLGVEQQFLADGDEIIFHYTDDWTLEDDSEWLAPDTVTVEPDTISDENGAVVAEVSVAADTVANAVAKALAAAGEGEAPAVGFRVAISEESAPVVTKVSFTLPAQAASALKQLGAVSIIAPVGDLAKELTMELAIDGAALAAALGDEDAGLNIILARADGAPLPEELAGAEAALYELNIYRLANDTDIVEVVWSDDSELTISLPYELKSGEKEEGVTVWHVTGDDATPVPSLYDRGAKKAIFTVKHLSYYAAGYVAPDIVKSDPVKKPVPNGGSGGIPAFAQIPDASVPTAPTPATLSYISGADRVLTSVAISRQGWESAETVILAPGGQNNLIDALAVAPLAGQEDAPILLSTGGLDPAVIAEIQRLGAKKVYAVGALSQAVIEALRAALPGLTIETLRGASRFETAALIGAKLTEPQGTFVVGYNAVADAVSVASFAAAHGYLIQIANADGTVGLAAGTPATGAPVYILGGPALVRDIPGATRLYGATRYETNKAIRDALPFEYTNIYTADGGTLVDALTGSALAARSGAAIVLTPGNNPAGTDFGPITAETKVYAFGAAK
ncbi:MAG: cell wall-binding repeat-containing protein [Gracilibacteraceae bacterium]|jgi:hypothetical protein|nr:cell wall-binding repeat-containing protein [Gracilibacteraceae bacterium]